uniref:BTB domain-containing protein n=1 Tax=Timema monikensis TaxID=170555 RepID=A0A7R9EG69_9NEOP|nr:unnamed protein product [Timema monikensis]
MGAQIVGRFCRPDVARSFVLPLEHVHNARNTPLIVHINDIKYSAMKTIVDFLYEGNVKEDDVCNFVTAAQYLQFDNIAPKIMKTCDVPTKTEAYKREAVVSLKPPAKKVKLIQPKVEEKPVLFVAHSFQPETELPEENQPFPVVCEYSEDEEKFINEHFKQRRNGRTYKNMKRSIKLFQTAHPGWVATLRLPSDLGTTLLSSLVTDGSENMDCGVDQEVERVVGSENMDCGVDQEVERVIGSENMDCGVDQEVERVIGSENMDCGVDQEVERVIGSENMDCGVDQEVERVIGSENMDCGVDQEVERVIGSENMDCGVDQEVERVIGSENMDCGVDQEVERVIGSENMDCGVDQEVERVIGSENMDCGVDQEVERVIGSENMDCGVDQAVERVIGSENMDCGVDQEVERVIGSENMDCGVDQEVERVVGSENMDCGVDQAVGRVVGAVCASVEERYKGRLNSEPQQSTILSCTLAHLHTCTLAHGTRLFSYSKITFCSVNHGCPEINGSQSSSDTRKFRVERGWQSGALDVRLFPSRNIFPVKFPPLGGGVLELLLDGAWKRTLVVGSQVGGYDGALVVEEVDRWHGGHRKKRPLRSLGSSFQPRHWSCVLSRPTLRRQSFYPSLRLRV